MEYKHEQTKPILRRRNGIRAFRILDIKSNSLIIRNPYNRERTFDLITVRNPDDYKVGSYIDVIFNKTGTSSYMTQILGNTPPEFVPANGEDVLY